MTRSLRLRRALLAAPALVLLSGCGIQGLQWHPGVAATVGDQTITDNRVDALAQDYCGAVRDQIKQSGNLLPLRYLRSAVIREMVNRAAAEQVAARYGVGPGDTYNQAVSQVQASTQGLSADQAKAVVTLGSLRPYIDAVEQAVGEKVYASRGSSASSDDQATKAGAQVLARWITDHDVEVDPRYGIVIKDGVPTDADTDVSFPLDSTAKAGLASSPDQAYATSLGSNQVCG